MSRRLQRALYSLSVIGVLLLASAPAAACGDGGGGTADGGTPGQTTPPGPTGPPGSTVAPPPGTSTPGSGDPGGGDWTSGPLTVTHEIAIPPVPMFIGIRSAPHPDQGFDRIVFDITGPLPGYTVRYVDEVRQDGSGELVTMPGRRYLLIVFSPAQAHTEDGTALISLGRVDLDYPMLRGYVLVGDFEGQVSVALGLDDVVGYRVGELPGNPARIYLDVAA